MNHEQKNSAITLVTRLIGLALLAGLVWGIWQMNADRKNEPEKLSKILEVQAGDWIKGKPEAPVALIEYSDFQCPACRSYHPVLSQLATSFPNQLKIVYRHYPLIGLHDNALDAAKAAEAAGLQGKFWEMADMLFAKQDEWSKASDVEESFVTYAQSLGLNADQFRTDFSGSAVEDLVEEDQRTAGDLGLDSTPTFFLNGEKIQNPGSLEDFKKLIVAEGIRVQVDQMAQQKVHEHVDFTMMINGELHDFSQAQYQSTDEKALSDKVHMHDGNGTILHKHKKGATLGDYFASVGIAFDSNCLTLESGEKYCDDGTKTLKFLVNGVPSDQYAAYEIHDLDRLLISYGDEDDAALTLQVASVGDMACIYSETCPERGKPPTENCVGGLGSGCDD